VFGEEDDELQHAVVRLLREQKQTLATAEWGTGGLVAEWLGGIDGVSDAYRGGLVITDQAALRNLDWLDENRPAGNDAVSPELVSAMAIGCRQRFGADFGLAVGPFPSPALIGGEPQPILLALASADGVQQKSIIPFAGHPAIVRFYCANHALNLARLALEAGRC
jgi:PncC family amidohydrolase